MSFSTFTRLSARRIALVATRTRVLPQVMRKTTSFAPIIRTFTSSTLRSNQQRQAVSEILKSELKLETESSITPEEAETPALFQNFLDKYGFEIVTTPGKNDAHIFKKTEAGETVSVFFDVAQVANLPYDDAMTEDVTTEKNNLEEEDFDSIADNFANVNVVVSKDVDGTSVAFDLLMNLQEGSFYVDSVTPFATKDAALNESAEAELSRELSYHGPPFSNLDEELQETLEIYLSSRGINEELSSFISAYSEFKENKEYIQWLENMKSFFN
ncbi:similar to Saccharomyces cerevisiae YIL070C MAM33 Acidic protein of the mitochondrial matrix involved in oxidative phosphorylation [Maudiozyma barnettii]|uniref:Similar to Saccharomyces cerevisiae YIL070C MAM33 Acidic protein of the mitochondrial matrix involved in oxidative phosphorylation n=1 Tax=Maudiozyma barnettii TaxID=61262 RepID=A0A8H2VBJ3_9SACH|nr:Mam33p [Kazachstania barnettii]CAB4252238.1 similar to Saccharomyces cerevisiae YIL070C MAM33 Acidic protein of the mitochondrial matrix involved in oxidative phosphorylation [Kazachstania barnettii]CAD1778895.1 similar to Saccharomyces cerevisiae YIL070C MAM33 Acidic protein of the mitochondrial matrix involved in oxidative phosphorylation [Kazachstania barnettii]